VLSRPFPLAFSAFLAICLSFFALRFYSSLFHALALSDRRVSHHCFQGIFVPDYNTQNPPNSIYPGDVALARRCEVCADALGNKSAARWKSKKHAPRAANASPTRKHFPRRAT
jgi:hypothetical protein